MDSLDGPFVAAGNTIRAGWWGLWLARVFGKKVVRTNAGFTVTMYHWRGVTYLYDFVDDSERGGGGT